ncbi:MAG: hypothetical protein AABX01_02500 [Candidatus Micrarchaeota archaeon]
MGDFFEDSIAAAKFGLKWFDDPKSHRLYFAFALCYLALFLIANYVLGLPVGASYDQKAIRALVESGQLTNLFAGAFTLGLVFMVPFLILSVMIAIKALNRLKIKARGVNANSVVGYVVVMIIVFLKSILLWHNKKWWVIILLPIPLFFLIGKLTLFFAFLAFLAYIFLVAYTLLRLCFGDFFYLADQSLSPSDAVKKSFKMTKGFLLKLFARFLISTIIVSVILTAIFILPQILLGFLDTIVGNSLLSIAFQALVSPMQLMAGTYSQVYIFSLLLQWNKNKSPSKAIKAK